MFFENKSTDEVLKENEKRTKELEIEIESIGRELKECYRKIGKTPEELKEHLSNSKNFTEEEWELILDERRSLEEILDSKIQKTNKKVAEYTKYRDIPPCAIFCK